MIHRLALCLLAVSLLAAADAPKKMPLDKKAVEAFNKAFAGDDSSAKKAAAAALGAKSTGDDSDILPLLMAKVDDRQASEFVMNALRARTGLPTAPVGESSVDRPKRPTDWRGWYVKWQEEQKTKAELAKAEAERAKLTEKVAELDPAKVVGDAAAATAATPGSDAAPVTEATKIAPDDLGKPVRILFVNGGSMRAYIQSRRMDADGNLVSVRIVHDNGGEETLAAELIARIDEE